MLFLKLICVFTIGAGCHYYQKATTEKDADEQKKQKARALLAVAIGLIALFICFVFPIRPR